jgi:tetratricopeptide (TPR) repeat protein
MLRARLAGSVRVLVMLWAALLAPVAGFSQAESPAPPTGQAVASGASAGNFDELVSAAAAAGERQDIPQAVRLTRQALKLNPAWAQGWWELGSMEFGQNDFSGAEAALTQLLAIDPDAGPARAMRGIAEFQTADYVSALADVQRAIALGAADNARNGMVLRYHEALLLTRNGRFEEALTDYEFFVKAGKTNAELFTALGLAGLRVPLLPKELGAGQQAMYEAAGKAVAAYQSGDDATAKVAFKDFFERFPNVPWSHFLYGYLLFQSDPAAALVEWRREVQIAPENPTAVSTLAWALLLSDEAAEALPFAEKAEALEPEKALSQVILGRALAETGDLDRGFSHLQEALRIDPDNLEAHFALAKADSLAGRNLDAQRERLYCTQAEGLRGNANARP